MNVIEINNEKYPFFLSVKSLLEFQQLEKAEQMDVSLMVTFAYKAFIKGCQKAKKEFPFTEEEFGDEISIADLVSLFQKVTEELQGKKPSNPKGKG